MSWAAKTQREWTNDKPQQTNSKGIENTLWRDIGNAAAEAKAWVTQDGKARARYTTSVTTALKTLCDSPHTQTLCEEGAAGLVARAKPTLKATLVSAADKRKREDANSQRTASKAPEGISQEQLATSDAQTGTTNEGACNAEGMQWIAGQEGTGTCVDTRRKEKPQQATRQQSTAHAACMATASATIVAHARLGR
ncbi:hypothetical protein ERJ75_000294400 [Trypanosoma vivax]|nr:hypothetical protein ERJ75_000294400 [Trypanosoma vivax]